MRGRVAQGGAEQVAGAQHPLKHARRNQLVERVDALDARLSALRQQQDRIKQQKKQIKLQKARQALLSQDRSA